MKLDYILDIFVCVWNLFAWSTDMVSVIKVAGCDYPVACGYIDGWQ